MVGLVSNIIQFIDIGTQVVAGAKAIYASTDGMTRENKNMEESTQLIRNLSIRLDVSTTKSCSDDERAVRRLAQQCRSLSEQLLSLIATTVPTNPKSRTLSVFAALKNLKRMPEIKELEQKLACCRTELHFHMDVLSRYGNREATLMDNTC